VLPTGAGEIAGCDFGELTGVSATVFATCTTFRFFGAGRRGGAGTLTVDFVSV
jgi:hypothetical protein